jgi:PAS domain S-box-containing protein
MTQLSSEQGLPGAWSGALGVANIFLDGRIASWDLGAERLFGYSAEEVLDQRLGQHPLTLHSADTRTVLARVIAGLPMDRHITRVPHRSGGVIDLELGLRPRRDASGKLIGARLMLRDVTASLAQWRGRLRLDDMQQWLDAQPWAMAAVSRWGKVLRANAEFLLLTGRTNEQLEGCTEQELHDVLIGLQDVDARQPMTMEAYLMALAQAQRPKLCLRGATPTCVEVFRRPLSVEPVGQLVVLNQVDIAAAQDMAMPLAVLHNTIERLATCDFTPDRVQAAMPTLWAQSMTLKRACDALLGVGSRSTVVTKTLGLDDTTPDSATPAPLRHLNEALSDWCAAHVPPPGRQPPVFHPTLQGAVVQDLASAVLRSLDALVSNAYRFSRDQTPVSITVRQRRITAVICEIGIEVRDHGLGMTARDLSHVGAAYFRADTTGAPRDAGLGVRVARALVDQHGGAITFESHLGIGTTATIWLPLHQADEAAP